ncbi:TPA: four helix bundle protein, partial [Candidatus Sumerlaeota bacterium]|nr:four helix bundle protein [Candidatus Sumerlaeota bacterium]
AYNKDRSYKTYKAYIEGDSSEVAANTALCLIHQANYLLDKLLRSLEKSFVEKGGFTERLYRVRKEYRDNQ